MNTAGINPKLISLLTGIPLDEVRQPVTVEALPGKWAAYASEAHKRIVYLVPGHTETVTCRICHRPAQYDIGMVLVSRRYSVRVKKTRSDLILKDSFQCMGYFRCRYCNGADSWEFPDSFYTRLIHEMLAVRSGRGRPSWVSITTADLFDGYMYSFATDAEEHFFGLMASQGETAYLWNRLGNLYFKSRRADLAMAALEKSLSLDANLMESDFTLGMILIQSGAEEAGARYLRQALAKAARYERLNANDLRDLLAHALIELARVHVKSGKAIAMLPSPEEWAEARNSTTDAGGDSDSHWVVAISGRSDDPTTFYPLAEKYLSPAQLRSLSNPSRQKKQHKRR